MEWYQKPSARGVVRHRGPTTIIPLTTPCGPTATEGRLMTFIGTLFIIAIFVAIVGFMLRVIWLTNSHSHRHT